MSPDHEATRSLLAEGYTIHSIVMLLVCVSLNSRAVSQRSLLLTSHHSVVEMKRLVRRLQTASDPFLGDAQLCVSHVLAGRPIESINRPGRRPLQMLAHNVTL